MHMSTLISRPVTKGQPNTSTVKYIFKQTRSFVSRFVSHLTTPGIGSNGHISNVSHSLHRGHAKTIQQSFSLPMRYALGRPLYAHHLPRPPSVPGHITHVGLGTARAFSTGRPIFQSLADNVPIAGRAFWEADWEVKMRQERRKMLAKHRKSKAARRSSKSKLESRTKEIFKSDSSLSASSDENRNADLDHYFPSAPTPEVITYLFIPLAPTPTSRVPLPPNPPIHISTHPLLPFSALVSVHTDHGTHSLRVSTLFARLDAARVFDDERVQCSPYGDSGGVCAALEVRFDGWTEDQVRSVLGEAGSGWCVLEEVWKGQEFAEEAVLDDVLSDLSLDDHGATRCTSPSPPMSPPREEIDPSTSFVLPTLDFSASFPGTQTPSWVASMSGTSTPLSDLEFHNAWTSSIRERPPERLGDLEDANVWSDSDSISSPPVSRRSSLGSDSWMSVGFSSEFSGRMHEQEVPEPKENVFQ